MNDAEIVRRYTAGEPILAITYRSKLYAALKRNGVQPNRQLPISEHDIIRRYMAGEPVKSIGNRSTVYSVLRRNGIDRTRQLKIAAAAALAVLLPAHSWYEASCCSEQDCRPVHECVLPDGRLGIEFMRGRCIQIDWSKVRAMPAPDGRWHACMPHKLIIGTPDPKCIYGPLGDA